MPLAFSVLTPPNSCRSLQYSAMEIKLPFPSPPKFSLPKPSTGAIFFLLPVLLIALIFFVVYPNDLRLQCLATAQCSQSPPPNLTGTVSSAATQPDLRILLGILTVPDTYERRSLIRHAYRLQHPRLAPAVARVDVRFVLCNLTTDEQRVLVAMEMELYGDVIVLDCAENVNDGKTYTYFSTLPKIVGGGRPYDYVVKTDDDTYYLLDKLSETLRRLPREDLYLGMRVPCKSTGVDTGFMSGMGYVLSWDLVKWISTAEAPKRKMQGPEDIMVGAWLNEAGRGRNRFDMNPRMYDYPAAPNNCFRHGFIPDTLAVHKLKDNAKWAKTLQYFKQKMRNGSSKRKA